MFGRRIPFAEFFRPYDVLFTARVGNDQIARFCYVNSFLSAVGNGTAKAAGTASPAIPGTFDGPNVVASGLAMAADDFSRTVGSIHDRMSNAFGSGTLESAQSAAGTGAKSTQSVVSSGAQSVNKGAKSVGTVAATTGRFAAGGGKLYFRGASAYLSFTSQSLASGISLVAQSPATFLGLVGETPVVSAAIRPADNTPVPIISAGSPIFFGAQTLLPALAAAQAAPAPDTNPQWPMHGRVTTLFGVPHWPYQPTHTGIDISDGNRSGTTPIRPFRPGTVVEVIHSYQGLGNHVVVDHGGGVTSVYAHLSSMTASVGQQVDKNAVIGYEGSTGASTGAHLHFEVRVNGQPVNPYQYVPGQP